MMGVFTRDYPLVVSAAFVFGVAGVAGSLLQVLLCDYHNPTINEWAIGPPHLAWASWTPSTVSRTASTPSSCSRSPTTTVSAYCPIW